MSAARPSGGVLLASVVAIMLGLTAALSLPLLGLAAVNAVWQLYALFLLIGLLPGASRPISRNSA
ncbi:hypothetical protein [Pseudomonas aeruginosa]|uniref:hypothetical protein n=1 Tax=Pseudomonas aeruginosa TaxID=287 RepID=UPI0012AC233D